MNRASEATGGGEPEKISGQEVSPLSTGGVHVGLEARDPKASLPVIGATLSVVAGMVGSPPIAAILVRLAASSSCAFNWTFVTFFMQHVQNSLRPIVGVDQVCK